MADLACIHPDDIERNVLSSVRRAIGELENAVADLKAFLAVYSGFSGRTNGAVDAITRFCVEATEANRIKLIKRCVPMAGVAPHVEIAEEFKDQLRRVFCERLPRPLTSTSLLRAAQSRAH